MIFQNQHHSMKWWPEKFYDLWTSFPVYLSGIPWRIRATQKLKAKHIRNTPLPKNLLQWFQTKNFDALQEIEGWELEKASLCYQPTILTKKKTKVYHLPKNSPQYPSSRNVRNSRARIRFLWIFEEKKIMNCAVTHQPSPIFFFSKPWSLKQFLLTRFRESQACENQSPWTQPFQLENMETQNHSGSCNPIYYSW